MKGSGEFVTDAQGRRWFVPLPPTPPKAADVESELDDARGALAALDKALAAFPVDGKQTVGRLFARFDAVLSAAAAGGTTRFGDLLAFESGARLTDEDDARAAAGLASAFSIGRAGERSLADTVFLIHRRLFLRSRRLLDEGATLGGPRTGPAAKPDAGQTGGFLGFTPPDAIEKSLAEWEAFAKGEAKGRGRPPEMDELVRQILAHWMLVHIQPVHDGNGRIGRLLIPLLLSLRGATVLPCAFVGEGVLRNRDDYIAALRGARDSGDFTWYCRFMLALMAQGARDNLARLNELADLHADWQEATAGFRSHSAARALVDWMLIHPRFSVHEAADGIGRTFAAANLGIGDLINETGLIRPVTGEARRNRLFEVPSVMRLFGPGG